MQENRQNDNAEMQIDQLRSRESTEKAYVRFVNLTNRVVEIIWINYSGQYARYQLLRENAYMNVDTFKTHPWIAQDVHTKDRMWLNKQYVYMPQTTREHLQNQNPNIRYPVQPPERRKVVLITLPILTLRYWALLTLRNKFTDPEPVEQLELPKPLQDDLKKVISLRNRRLSISAVAINSS